MRKIKQFATILLSSLFIFLFFTACNINIDSNKLIKNYEVIKGEKINVENNEDYNWYIPIEVIILFSENSIINDYYYILDVKSVELDYYQCKNYNEILTNQKFIQDDNSDLQKIETHNRQLSIVGYPFPFRITDQTPTLEVMIYIYDNTENLSQYKDSIKIEIS